ncbi:tape measure protein [Limosilactobacillus reuteri]|uniref:Tape measure protein n=1 Tax=Limosilactobacillus reuteri TaxID=1598 RepID=A0A317GJ49_LIMRT|nr:tape measure protein [Limosilactobacillus reuteri]MCH5384687.1 tape measure protein [Limosilactobacillus reuteri]PWT48588.1 tape measure protein [Limosilactobacillus reuteri]PWT53240.1 tape measure protein [Limosilactobacillus reuteri]PWT63849.1 tape measure protein [Limosilactobacillus reuteri]
MVKVSNEMATKVALDMVEASSAVKNLTTLVNSHTQAWKAQTAALRSAGDYVGAAKAKYEGLGNAISAQRNKIEALEQKQAEMNNIDKKTADRYMELRSKLNQYRSEMDKLDTTTAKGEARSKELAEQIAKTKEQLDGLDTGTVKSAEQFLKYGQQVDRAKAKLASLEAQQQRAAQQIDVENSGVIRLTASMRTQAALATATAERLRSEGNSYQAMGVEVNGLRAKLDSLRQIQSRETELLASTKARTGETSEAYLKQATRVEELGTKIQETRSKLNELNETMSKTPHGWLAGVSARLDNIQGKADRVSTSFGRIFGATAAANMFTGALSSITGRMGDLIKAGADYNIEQNKMNATWTTLTGSAKEAQPMVDSINNMSKATGQNVDIVNELEQGFYHLNSSKKQADGMTSSLLNMADAVGLNGDQIKAVEQDMVHGMATGKITQGELNQIGQYFPMIDEAMAKHFNTTVSGMRQMASAGKITSKDLEDVFEQLGNGKYKEAAENMMNSYFGVFRTIQSRTPQLVGDITKPFMNISNPFLKSVRNWVNDKSTDTEFTKLGNQMARSMNQIISAFGGTNVSATKLMDNAIHGLTTGVQKFGDIVSSHHTQIANFFSAFKSGSAAQTKIFASVFMDLSKVMLPVLDTMAKFPKTSAALIMSFLLASRAVKTLQAGVKGLETIKTVSGVIRTFGQKIKSIPNRKITKIQVDGAKSTRDLQSYSNRLERIPKTKRTKVQASTIQANRSLGAVQRQAQRVPRTISVRANASTAQAVANISRVGTTSRTAATLSRTSFTLIGTSAKIASTGLSLIGGPAGAIMLVVQGFQLLYQHSAKFRKFTNGIVNSAKSMAGKAGRWLGNFAKGAGKSITSTVKRWQRGWKNMNKQSQRSTQQEMRYHQRLAKEAQRQHTRMWSSTKKEAVRGWSKLNQRAARGVQQQIRQHQQMAKREQALHNRMWDTAKNSFSNGWNGLQTSTKNGVTRINSQFDNMKLTVAKRAHEAMQNAGNHFKNGYNDIKTQSGNWRDKMADLWGNTKDKIGSLADNIRSGSTNKFSDMHSKLNDLTDGGLGKMEDAWHGRLESIAGVITNSGKHIWQQFVDLLTTLAKPFKDLINDIIEGVNWVLDHVGGDGKLGKFKFSFGSFANGTPNGGILHDQVALLNDGNGSHYQEMVHKASTGETFMLPPKRNLLLPLQKGDEVLDGERSHKLATMMQIPIPHANGAIGDFFSGLWNGAKELEDIAEDALKNVVGFGKSLFTHFVANVAPKSTDSINGGLKLNLPGFYAEHLKEWMKKQLDDLGSDTPKNGNWAPVVKKALRKNGLPDSEAYVNAWLKQIQTESGGNPKAVQGNIGDINNATGDLAKGLVQTISATFNAYKFPGHGNIFNGYDNLLAGIAYAKAKYGASGMLSVIGHGHGYANGGIATTPSIFGEAGPEMAIPLDTMKSTRAWQLLRQVVTYYSGGQTTNNTKTTLVDLSKVEKKFDTVLAQNAALINAIERLIGVTDSANNPTARYRRTQRDINLAQAQSLTGI